MKIKPTNSWLEDRHRHQPRKEKKVKGKDFEKHLRAAMGVKLYEKFLEKERK